MSQQDAQYTIQRFQKRVGSALQCPCSTNTAKASRIATPPQGTAPLMLNHDAQDPTADRTSTGQRPPHNHLR